MKAKRINRLWSTLKNKNIDATFINDPSDTFYFTGFTGSESALLLTRKEKLLMIDSRYSTQARGECRGVRIIETDCKIKEAINCIKKLGVRGLGYEPDKLTINQYRELEKTSMIRLESIQGIFKKLRSIKDPGELNILKKTATISSKGFLGVLGSIKPGVTEREIALLLEFQIKKNGADATPFPFIVASGKRGALPHGLASRKKIRKGELVTIDFGATYRGYCSDESCTVIVGKPTEKQKMIYKAVKNAHDEAVEKVRPGIKAHEIDSAARRIVEEAGLGKYFRHGTGHGVGLCVHEGPRIAPKQEDEIEEGMVFTIEPGVYIPGWGGARIEDMVRVTRQGCEILSSVPKELNSI